MSVVRDFCGHGLGRLFHDEPNIVHIGRPGEGIVLKPGMLFTIEPMINLGRPHVKVLSDGWTAVTRDRSLSAQFEHTVGVTQDGVEVFTLSPKGRAQAAYLYDRAIAIGIPVILCAFPGDRCRTPQTSDEPASPKRRRIITATASGCARAFAKPARRRSPTTRCSNFVLFRAIPRRDVKPLAKELIEKFGSFAEVISAPPAAPRRRSAG